MTSPKKPEYENLNISPLARMDPLPEDLNYIGNKKIKVEEVPGPPPKKFSNEESEANEKFEINKEAENIYSLFVKKNFLCSLSSLEETKKAVSILLDEKAIASLDEVEIYKKLSIKMGLIIDD